MAYLHRGWGSLSPLSGWGQRVTAGTSVVSLKPCKWSMYSMSPLYNSQPCSVLARGGGGGGGGGGKRDSRPCRVLARGGGREGQPALQRIGQGRGGGGGGRGTAGPAGYWPGEGGERDSRPCRVLARGERDSWPCRVLARGGGRERL